MIVKLTPREMRMACLVGVERQIGALEKRRVLHYGCKSADAMARHITGALAELAVAKAFNRNWGGVETCDYDGDVDGLHVRATSHPNGRLILHPADRPAAPYILVRGHDDTWDLSGWCYGYEGQEEQYWSDPSGQGRYAYFVPADELRDIATLIEIHERAA